MSIFNIFKRKKQASREQLLEENRGEQKLSSDDDSLSYQYNLSVDHKNDDKQPVVHEQTASDNKHKNKDITEASLETRISNSDNDGYFRHKNDDKEYHMPDISIASEKRDREFRDAYADAESKLKEKKNYFTAMSGMQLDRKPNMIPDNIPLKDSGLNIAPERFENFGETPDGDAKENLKNYGKNPDITPMKFASSKSSEDILSMIRDADALSFSIKTQAMMGNADNVGVDNLSKIRAAKAFLVESLRAKTAEWEDYSDYDEFSDKINGMDLKDVMKDLLEYEERGLSHREMASSLGISEDEVRSILQRKDEYLEFDDSGNEDTVAEDKINEIDQRLRSIVGE
tara:strand:- start:5249 stop:6277 length:1029 start_codon:yes stop_codon:yes gene_type:complete